MSYGFVYILGNPAFPNIFKIGMTSRSPSLRCKELSDSTAAPSPFVLVAYYEFANPREVEQEIHEWLDEYRVSENREFFEVDVYYVAEEIGQFRPLSTYESPIIDIVGMGGEPFPSTKKARNTEQEDE